MLLNRWFYVALAASAVVWAMLIKGILAVLGRAG